MELLIEFVFEGKRMKRLFRMKKNKKGYFFLANFYNFTSL